MCQEGSDLGARAFLPHSCGEALKTSLAEDAEDLAAFEERAAERSVSFEKVVREMRRRGKL